MAVRKQRSSWWVDFRFAGERFRRRSPDNSREGAKAFELILRGRLARGEPLEPTVGGDIGPSYPVFADFASRWFDLYAVTNNRPAEQRKKRRDLRLHLVPFFGRMPLDQIKPLHIEQYKSQKLSSGLHPKTINNQLAIFGKCLRTAHEWEELDRVPKVKLLRVPESPFDFLALDDLQRLLADNGEPFWNGMIRLASSTGMRLGELQGLEWRDIDFGRRVVTIGRSYSRGTVGPTKSGRVRRVRIPEELASELLRRRRPEGRVFASPFSNRALDQCTAQRALERACKRSGLRRITWHVLRHTFASQLVRTGVSLQVIQGLLGHSTITMTTRYAHVSEDLMADAVERLSAHYRATHTENLVTPWSPPAHSLPEIGTDPPTDLRSIDRENASLQTRFLWRRGRDSKE